MDACDNKMCLKMIGVRDQSLSINSPFDDVESCLNGLIRRGDLTITPLPPARDLADAFQ